MTQMVGLRSASDTIFMVVQINEFLIERVQHFYKSIIPACLQDCKKASRSLFWQEAIITS